MCRSAFVLLILLYLQQTTSFTHRLQWRRGQELHDTAEATGIDYLRCLIAVIQPSARMTQGHYATSLDRNHCKHSCNSLIRGFCALPSTSTCNPRSVLFPSSLDLSTKSTLEKPVLLQNYRFMYHSVDNMTEIQSAHRVHYFDKGHHLGNSFMKCSVPFFSEQSRLRLKVQLTYAIRALRAISTALRREPTLDKLRRFSARTSREHRKLKCSRTLGRRKSSAGF